MSGMLKNRCLARSLPISVLVSGDAKCSTRASGITAGSSWLTGSFLPVRRVASVADSTRTCRWQTRSGFVAGVVLVTTGISNANSNLSHVAASLSET